MIRNHAVINARRLELAEMIGFWRQHAEKTSDPIRLDRYEKIIARLRALSEELEGTVAHAGN